MTTIDSPRSVQAFAGAIAELRAHVHGDVFTPDEPEWQNRRLAWNRLKDHDPAVIVAAADVGDVAAAVRFARERGLGVGVQATGHGMVRPVDGVLIDTSRLNRVEVDPERRMATVGAGCTWAPVLAAAQLHGLAPLLGSSSGVGAVGYTLGGGLGWLARAYGPASDHVHRFDVVTADGRLVCADRTENRPLFDALRGGGGGALAIVTSMTIELVPVTEVYGGDLLYPVERPGEVVGVWARWAAASPEELTSSVGCMNFPPIPDVPEVLRGRSFVIVRGCWSGDAAAGRSYVDRLRAEIAPIADTWRVLPFTEVDGISNDPTEPLPAVGTGGWLTHVDGAVGEVLAEHTFPTDGPPALLFSEIRHIGSTAWRRDDGSVLGNRHHDFLFHAVGVPGPVSCDAVEAQQGRLKAALGGALADGIYLNFLDHEERRTRTSDGVHPERRARVAELRREIDPSDCLRYGVGHS